MNNSSSLNSIKKLLLICRGCSYEG